MIKSHLLYQLSYTPINIGASDGARTHNLDLGKVALYQLSYTRFKRTGETLSERPRGRNREFKKKFMRALAALSRHAPTPADTSITAIRPCENGPGFNTRVRPTRVREPASWMWPVRQQAGCTSSMNARSE